MAKRIVVLNGSPRRNGNTSRLIEAFKEGAEDSGNTVRVFFLQGMEIHGRIRITPASRGTAWMKSTRHTGRLM